MDRLTYAEAKRIRNALEKRGTVHSLELSRWTPNAWLVRGVDQESGYSFEIYSHEDWQRFDRMAWEWRLEMRRIRRMNLTGRGPDDGPGGAA